MISDSLRRVSVELSAFLLIRSKVLFQPLNVGFGGSLLISNGSDNLLKLGVVLNSTYPDAKSLCGGRLHAFWIEWGFLGYFFKLVQNLRLDVFLVEIHNFGSEASILKFLAYSFPAGFLMQKNHDGIHDSGVTF